MERFDLYDDLPRDMRKYLSTHGWHFSKAMAEWAISRMKDKGGNAMRPMEKSDVDNMLRQNGGELKNDKGYDALFVWQMLKSDYGADVMTNDSLIAKGVRDYLDDPDGYDGIALTRFYADCIGKGLSVSWNELI